MSLSRQAKWMYRKMFGNKTSSGEIGLNIRTLASPKMGQDQVSSVGIPLPLQMFYWHLSQLGNEVQIGNRVNNLCNAWSVEGVTVYGHHPECRVTFWRGLILFDKISVPTIELSLETISNVSLHINTNVTIIWRWIFIRDITVVVWENGRDLTQSYDKSPYTNRNVKRAKWQHKQRHKKVRLNSGCGPT